MAVGRVTTLGGVLPSRRKQRVGDCNVEINAKGEVIALKATKTFTQLVYSGHNIKYTEPKKNESVTYYDGNGNTLPSSTGAAGASSSVSYDAAYYTINGFVSKAFSHKLISTNGETGEVTEIGQVTIPVGYYNNKKITQNMQPDVSPQVKTKTITITGGVITHNLE